MKNSTDTLDVLEQSGGHSWNEPRTPGRVVAAFTAFVAILPVATTGVLAYASRQTKRDYGGDIFDRLSR